MLDDAPDEVVVVKTDASGAPNSFAGGADRPERVYVSANRGDVAHLDENCWRLQRADGTPETVDREAAPDRVCADCDLCRRIEAALAAHREGGERR